MTTHYHLHTKLLKFWQEPLLRQTLLQKFKKVGLLFDNMIFLGERKVIEVRFLQEIQTESSKQTNKSV